jgi:FKBP-type peptidyl-prolyl cis-trans isomerase FkpA
MATTKTQRIGIWIIAIFMAVGTIGSFAIIALANDNQKADQARVNELNAKYQKETQEYQAKVAAQAAELSGKYYEIFKQYESRPAVFDADAVTELKTEDLVVGDGEALTNQSTFTAYYIGWTPDANIFDSSFTEDQAVLKAPIEASPGGVIKGWTEGVAGMKVGGVREITIPSELGYGATGSGASIKPNTPLKFIVMVIPTPEKISQPEVPQELINYYQRGRL